MSDQIYYRSTVDSIDLAERLTFLRRTYGHLLGASIAFVLASAFLKMIGLGEEIIRLMEGSRIGFLALFGGFMVVSWAAQAIAERAEGKGAYLGLFLYVWAYGVIFAPLLYIAERYYPGTITSATLITLLAFGGLTFYVFATKKDFSFLRGILAVSSFIALGAILLSVFMGFELGIWFSAIMLLFCTGAVLYTTSRVMNEFESDQYVLASMELFAAVAMMLWYVLRLLMQMRR